MKVKRMAEFKCCACGALRGWFTEAPSGEATSVPVDFEACGYKCMAEVMLRNLLEGHFIAQPAPVASSVRADVVRSTLPDGRVLERKVFPEETLSVKCAPEPPAEG